MPRMRTVPEAHKELLEKDPNTSFTLSALKRLVRTGKIPCICIGKKRLVNMDILENYLNKCVGT